MKQFRSIFVSTAFLATVPLFAAPDAFTVDKVHSAAEFKIRHMMSNVGGKFDDFAGTVNVDREKPANSTVEFTIQTASIDTATPDRDKHLKSADFFDVEKYPTITFKSTKVAPTEDEGHVRRDRRLHDARRHQARSRSRSSSSASVKDPWGNERAGFELNTTLNRKDYGINWNKALDQGGYLLADDVKIDVNLETVPRKKQ